MHVAWIAAVLLQQTMPDDVAWQPMSGQLTVKVTKQLPNTFGQQMITNSGWGVRLKSAVRRLCSINGSGSSNKESGS